ncbi:hypothetical protein BDZ94DRAFT_1316143 [Collybia nuda]|uniref:Uncharacterized protein n=1 Tax=Collybia nuda TaxID=64659 RepID=A0A9P5XQ51_9AGAR|nr:hypothetical protein BDZ94DRAFT_1316143 [Collybia nuda]
MVSSSRPPTERKSSTFRVTRSMSQYPTAINYLKAIHAGRCSSTHRPSTSSGVVVRVTQSTPVIGHTGPNNVDTLPPIARPPTPLPLNAPVPNQVQPVSITRFLKLLAYNLSKHMETKGLLYPLYSKKPIVKTFASDPQPMDPSRLPEVTFANLFNDDDPTDPPVIHRCLVLSGSFKFLIYGYVKERAHINEALSIVRPSVLWRGEVVVFTVGCQVPFIARTRATRKMVKDAVARYLSLISEALDNKEVPPSKISMNITA